MLLQILCRTKTTITVIDRAISAPIFQWGTPDAYEWTLQEMEMLTSGTNGFPLVLFVFLVSYANVRDIALQKMQLPSCITH